MVDENVDSLDELWDGLHFTIRLVQVQIVGSNEVVYLGNVSLGVKTFTL